MKISMDDMRLTHISELEAFLQGSKKVVISVVTIEDKYALITTILTRFGYHRLTRREKHIVFLYLKKLTGYKKVQLYRLIAIGLRPRDSSLFKNIDYRWSSDDVDLRKFCHQSLYKR